MAFCGLYVGILTSPLSIRKPCIFLTEAPAVLLTLPVVCKVTEFTCTNGRRCVPQSAVCDTWLDCQDGSDEYKCASHSKYYDMLPLTVSIMTCCLSQ